MGLSVRCASNTDRSLWWLTLLPLPACTQLDEDVKGIVGLLVRCAFGRPAEPGARIPGRVGCVEVAVRECAFNPLSPPSSAQPRDETIYVAFQQRVGFEVRWGAAARVCLIKQAGTQPGLGRPAVAVVFVALILLEAQAAMPPGKLPGRGCPNSVCVPSVSLHAGGYCLSIAAILTAVPDQACRTALLPLYSAGLLSMPPFVSDNWWVSKCWSLPCVATAIHTAYASGVG